MGLALDPDVAEDVLDAYAAEQDAVGAPDAPGTDPEPSTPDPSPEPVETPPAPPETPETAIGGQDDDVVGELVLRPREELVEVAAIPGREEFLSLAAQAKVYAGSNLVPEALRGKPEDVFLLLASARDLGLAPTIALRKMYVVDSQVTIAPALKMALVRMKGAGKIWKPRPQNPDGTWPDPDPPVADPSRECIVYGQRTDDDYIERVHIEWEQMEKVRYGYGRKYVLTEKDNWQNYPWRMLWWRAVTQLIDDLWPEIGFGLYTPDEIGAMTDEDGRPIDVRSAPAPEGYRQAAKFDPPGSTGSPGEELAPDRDAIQARIDALPKAAQEELRARWKERITFSDDKPIKVADLTRRAASLAKALIAGVESEARSGRYAEEAPPAESHAVICGACGAEEQADGSCECAPDEAQRSAPIEVDGDDDLGRPFD